VNVIRKDISEGRVSFGTWLMNPGAAAAEAFARLGFGWIVVDLQHGGIGWEGAMAVMPAIELGGAQALIRVGWNDPALIMRALDLGAAGVVIPCVDSAEEAKAAAQAAHYPPLGRRSLGPIRRTYGAPGSPDAEPLCIAMIESVRGLEAAHAIAAIKGIDALLLGPGDMAIDMGLPLAADPDERVVAAAHSIVAACRAHGKIAAAASFSHAASVKFMAAGMDALVVGSDAQFLAAGASLVLGRIAEMRADGADLIQRQE
jgi:4-hydroxy-2-oxoheptanedioate aldolase